MSKKRNHYSAEFKAKLALAALRNDETMAELTARVGWAFLSHLQSEIFPLPKTDHNFEPNLLTSGKAQIRISARKYSRPS